MILFVTGINTSTTFANVISEAPLVGNLVKVLTIRAFKIDDNSFQTNLEVPTITNLEMVQRISPPLSGKAFCHTS